MPRRRWLQFSIRTVLVLVTLLCVALSVWIVPAERRRRAVAAIEAMGGRISFKADERIEGKVESLVISSQGGWLPRAYVDEVESVGLDNTQVTDAGVAHLHGLTSLFFLSLDNTQVTDAGLAHLHGVAGLRQLYLSDTRITDAGLAHLKGLTALRSLDLANTQVTDAGLAHLHGVAGLRQLYLNDTRITDAGLVKLRKALPKCQIFGP